MINLYFFVLLLAKHIYSPQDKCAKWFGNYASIVQVGLSQARRLAQGKVIRIRASSPFPVQIDGEPFIQQPGCLEITHHGQVVLSFCCYDVSWCMLKCQTMQISFCCTILELLIYLFFFSLFWFVLWSVVKINFKVLVSQSLLRVSLGTDKEGGWGPCFKNTISSCFSLSVVN